MTEPTTELPAWIDLSESDKAAAVFFIRTAEGEGLEYAAENYAVKFRGDDSEEQMRRLARRYRRSYSGLSLDDFWHLYNIGEKAR